MPGAALRPKRRSSVIALICGLIHRLAETVFRTRPTTAAAAARAPLPDARTCSTASRGTWTRMTFTGLLASTQGPSADNAISTRQ